MALDAPMPRRFTRSVPLADILAEMAGFGLGNPDDLTGQIGGFDKFSSLGYQSV
jgi:hypothetical protein